MATFRAQRPSRPRIADLTLVWGPPCSGKTTHVATHKQPGDIVIDYDAIAVALGSPSSHDHPAAMRPIIVAAWLAALHEAERQPVRMWLIKGFPTPAERKRATRTVLLDTPRAECEDRARHLRPGTWLPLIADWYTRYSPDGHQRIAATAGRSTTRWRKLRATIRARHEDCTYCHQPIDYTLPSNHPKSFTVAHRLSVHDHPELAEDIANIRGAAHRDCNSRAGDEDLPETTGGTSYDW